MFGYFSYSSPSNSRPSSPASSTYSSYSISPLAISSSQSSTQTPSCAFPSWPRRSSLDGSVNGEASSYISDDDLFPEVFDDSESDCTPLASPCRSPPHNEGALISRSSVRDLLALKEQQPKKQRRSSRKSKSSSGKPMSPIQEVGE